MDIEQDEIPDTQDAIPNFDWGVLGADFWAGARDATGATWLQTRFAACRQRGLDNTKCARESGYQGGPAQLRSVGYRAFRTNKIQELLALAGAEAGEPLGHTDREERRRVLDTMVRHGDSSAKLAAIKALEAMDEVEAALGVAPTDDGFAEWRSGRDFIMTNANGGTAFVLLLSGQSLALGCLPLLHDLHRDVVEHWPQVWDRLLKRQSPTMLEHLQNNLADPNYQLGARQKVWGERGWIVDVDGRARPDPAGRRVVKQVTPFPTSSAEATNERARPGSEGGADAAPDADNADEAINGHMMKETQS